MKFEMGENYYHVSNGKMYQPTQELDGCILFRVYNTETEQWVSPVVMNKENTRSMSGNLMKGNIPFNQAVKERKMRVLREKLATLYEQKEYIEVKVVEYEVALKELEND